MLKQVKKIIKHPKKNKSTHSKEKESMSIFYDLDTSNKESSNDDDSIEIDVTDEDNNSCNDTDSPLQACDRLGSCSDLQQESRNHSTDNNNNNSNSHSNLTITDSNSYSHIPKNGSTGRFKKVKSTELDERSCVNFRRFLFKKSKTVSISGMPSIADSHSSSKSLTNLNRVIESEQHLTNSGSNLVKANSSVKINRSHWEVDDSDSLRKRVFKKHSSKVTQRDRVQSEPLRSWSAENLRAENGRHKRKSSPSHCHHRLWKDGNSFSRNRVVSLEQLRENRLSVISKLDEYIDHVKNSIDDDNIAYAPSRLCCAQILRTVYLIREQQHIYNSLHPNNNCNNNNLHGYRSNDFLPYCNSVANFRKIRRAQTLSAGSIHSLSTTAGSRPTSKVTWQQGSESETSSSTGEDIVFGEYYDSSDNDFKEKEDEDSSFADYDDGEEDRLDKTGSHGLKKCRHKKSNPAFPQHFDIY